MLSKSGKGNEIKYLDCKISLWTSHEKSECKIGQHIRRRYLLNKSLNIYAQAPKFMGKKIMLNSTEHEIYPIHNEKMPTIVGIIVGILTFISRINIQHLRVLKLEKSKFSIKVSMSS